jgi:hypothetical protein
VKSALRGVSIATRPGRSVTRSSRSALRGFRALQRRAPGFLGSVWFASSPYVLALRGPEGVRLPAPLKASAFSYVSRALRRHLERLSPSSLPPFAASRFEFDPRLKAPRLSFFHPSAFADGPSPFFRFSRNVRKRLPFLPEDPPAGFGYPLGGLRPFHPWKRFSFQRSGAFPFRAFIPAAIVWKFPSTFSAFALYSKTVFGFGAAPERFDPAIEAVLLSRRIRPGRSRMLSWACGSLGLSLRRDRWRKHLPFSIPLTFLVHVNLATHAFPNPRGFLPRRFGVSLRGGRRPV